MWCENVPALTALVPERPTQVDAASALRMIRKTFKTFCFADAETVDDAGAGVPVVDTSKPPSRDESSFLVALLNRSISVEPAPCARRVVAGGAHLRCRCRQRTARPLHLYRRVWT
jgi:hypothetical protein